ncbi:MAG TPA: acetate--CoA ligase family protein, partial [Thermoanaerobaculia bacterium]|nr:acetate--CoA ligase family protein [Thermoanaerobaculia bacterium]
MTTVVEPGTGSRYARESLRPIFEPRTVAVVGASRNRDSIGFSLVHNLVVHELSGTIFPVNPHADSIHSLKAYPSVSAIPDPVDLAVVAVPKGAVKAVVEECLAAGVRGLVVITAGFGETGAEGARAEAELRELVRRHGVRVIGPNCMGVINTDPEVRLNATFAPTPANPGSIGFVSQSGALGVAILNVAQDRGVGLTQFVSMGNKADVSGNDLLEYWEEDEATRVIAMYLESFGNPRRFTEIAKRVGRKKPILVVKSGRTTEGARAASSHTGAIAGTDVTVSAFLERCGVVRANTIEELFDLAVALDRCPLARGSRVAIVTNAGGPAIMATDACVNLGLEIAELSEATRAKLRQLLPAEASVANPVDMIASATAEQYAQSLAIVLEDPAVDLAMVINVTPLLANPIDVMEEIGGVARGGDVPVLAVMMATEEFYEEIKDRGDLPPVYRFPEPAARVLAQLVRYGAWRRRPAVEEPPEFEVDDAAVARLLERTGEGYLPPDAAFRVLELYGIPVAGWRYAPNGDHGREAALAAAAGRDGDDGHGGGTAPAEAAGSARREPLAFPVVAKAHAPQVVHKSDVGAVVVGIEDEEALERALAEIEERLSAAGHPPEGYLVQEMVKGGHEVIFGISTDPRFGPLLMFGLGGRYVEVFRDVRFGVTPLVPTEAEEMIRGIRGVKLLEGVRGE